MFHCSGRSSETEVTIRTEAERNAIIGNLSYWKGQNKWGLTLDADTVVGAHRLQKGDVVVPSAEFLNTGKLQSCALPQAVTFWRFRYEDGTRYGMVQRRNPIFSNGLLEPYKHCASDILHTIAYGPGQRWTSAAVWRVVLANPWGLGGSKKGRLDACVAMVDREFREWCTWGTADQLGEISVSTLGGEPPASVITSGLHEGGVMRFKAGETLVLMRFAVHLVERHQAVLPYGKDLFVAGEALAGFLSKLKELPFKVPQGELQGLFDAMQLHLVRSHAARIAEVPKHHFASHLAERTDRRPQGFFNESWRGKFAWDPRRLRTDAVRNVSRDEHYSYL